MEVVGGEDHNDLRAGARGRAEAGGGGDIGAGDVGADGARDELDEGVVAAEAAAREATADGVDPVDEEDFWRFGQKRFIFCKCSFDALSCGHPWSLEIPHRKKRSSQPQKTLALTLTPSTLYFSPPFSDL